MNPKSEDLLRVVALLPPLAVRFYADGTEAALQRLLLLAVATALSYGWAILFARRTGRPLGEGILPYALTFVLLLPGPVEWLPAVLAISFGAVFGREIFGGKAVLPPAAIGLSFAIFSFPGGGFELRGILDAAPDIPFALACLPGAALLIWKDVMPWRIALGAVAGAAAAGFLMGAAEWWVHYATGAFAAGVIFLAAAPEAAPRREDARWIHGLLVGALILLIRLANPDQPDGAVFAALLVALFAPLIDRAVSWRPRHG